jgi:dienelactone hydrolase
MKAVAYGGVAALIVACLVTGIQLTTGQATPSAPGGSSAPVVAASLRARPSSTPDKDDFYRQPTDGGAEPGDLLRYRQSQVYPAATGSVPAPVHAWQMLYRSTSAKGAANAVSGTLVVPELPWTGSGPRPIIGYAVATHGLADQCAPSYRLAMGTEAEQGQLAKLVLRGWAIAITDYEGLGTPGEHTYVVQRSEGHAVLDAVRAAIRLPDSGLSADAPVGLLGYSQGGGAVAVAAEQAPDYAPELKTVGVAEGGVPADLAAMARSLQGSRFFGLAAAAIVGMNAAYPELEIGDSLSPLGRRLFALFDTGCVSAFISPELPFHRSRELGDKDDPLAEPKLLEKLTENRVGSVAPRMPVRLYHAQRDEFIPPAVARALFAEYCRRGARVQFEMFPGKDHGGAAAAGMPDAVAWLAARFDGDPAPNSCAR